MARRSRSKAEAPLTGAEEFAGSDTEQAALDAIAAARAAQTEAEQDKKGNGHNGGPLMDEAAWRRAANEAVAEDIEIGRLMEQVAEARGRLSSIRKVAKSCGVDWDVIKEYVKLQKRIRNGESGAIVTEHRRMGELMKMMDCALYTQFDLFKFAEAAAADAASNKKPGMDAELQGQHSYSNNEPLTNNPYTQGTEEYFDWAKGWRNAQDAKARGMGPAPTTPELATVN